jgi:hypothetical protein
MQMVDFVSEDAGSQWISGPFILRRIAECMSILKPELDVRPFNYLVMCLVVLYMDGTELHTESCSTKTYRRTIAFVYPYFYYNPSINVSIIM